MRTSPSEGETKGVSGRRDEGVACGGVSTYTEFRAPTALKPVHLKRVRQNHLLMREGGLGNTVQQHVEEWKEEANVISSQSTTSREEQTQLWRSRGPSALRAAQPAASPALTDATSAHRPQQTATQKASAFIKEH